MEGIEGSRVEDKAMVSRQIDLVINRTARRYARRPALLDDVHAIAKGACQVHVSTSLTELDDICAELGARGSDLVLFSGGDGTLMAGASALVRHFAQPPALAPIPAGTACTVARNWGLYGETRTCLRRMLNGPRRLIARPSLAVTSTEDGIRCPRIGFIVGSGLVAKFFSIYEERGAPGYLGAAMLVARIFAESLVGGPMARRVLEPLSCTLVVNGRELLPPAWSLICSAVVPNLGIHMLLTHRAGEDPLRPHLVATPMPPGKLGPRAPWVLAGQSIGGPDLVDELVDGFELRFAGHGPWVLDGELLQASQVSVRAGPLLTVATP